MPVLDGDFAAFVTNLGKYNEGALVGEWVKFPTTREEMQKVFERIGIGSADDFGQPYEEFFITDYECPVYGVYNLLGEYVNLDKLNYLAARVEELDKREQEKLVAVMESGCDEVSNIDDFINLTFNLNCYDFIPDIHNDIQLGYYYIHDAGIYSEKELGPLANYIDYGRFGRDVAMDESGRFTDDGYVRSTGDHWQERFNGTLEDIPDEYRIIGGEKEPAQDKKAIAVVVQPEKKPEIREIDTSLEGLQALVGGRIQAVYPYDDPVALVCNEEGKLEGLPLNRALRDEDGIIYDIVAGTFAIVGLGEEGFCPLSDDFAAKYAEAFAQPEEFTRLGNSILAIPMDPEEQQAPAQKDFVVSMDTEGLAVAGHVGTWHTIDRTEVGGHTFWLMEHDVFGDTAPCVVVDEHGKLTLSDVYDGFDARTVQLLEMDVMPVDRLPDDSITVDEMKNYGYAWGGMLPLGEEAAAALSKTLDVYCLYRDDTDDLVMGAEDIKEHASKGGIFGVEKAVWLAALEKENPLKAAEMSVEDDYGMIDGMINNGPKEEKAPEQGEKASILDRLRAAKSEPPKEKPAPHKAHKTERDL